VNGILGQVSFVPELASADEVKGFWPRRIMVCLDLKRRAA